MLPPDTLLKLGKLIPLLGSDKDGEVVAAVRAIERTLKDADSDWHDLTAMVVGKRTGWVPDGGARRASASATASGRFNYANAFRESEPLFEGPEHPEATSRKFGLPIYAVEIIEPWREVARHCLRLDRTLPKKHGGKCLEPWQKAMLKTFEENPRQPTNRHVEWIERMVARLHQARDAAARAAS